jgi:glycosyltransferase involved in cell wall biosynthesis
MDASITFILPAYNEEKLIPFAIRSIQEEMAGRPNDYEILVVDNASTDRTSKVVLEHGAQRTQKRNCGSKARRVFARQI